MLCAVLIAAPRFNRNDLLIGKWTQKQAGGAQDSDQYELFVSVLRNEAPRQELEAPFCYRPLVPLIAAGLPFRPDTSLNTVNIVLLLASLLLLHRIMALLMIPSGQRLLGGAMFAFSFPLFYYGTISCVDPGALLIITIGLYAILRDRPLALFLIITFGVLVKETSVLLIPVYMTRMLMQKRKWHRVIGYGILCSAAVVAVSWLARSAFEEPGYLWLPSSQRLMRNITRAGSWLSFLLSFGLPGGLCLFAVLKYKPWRIPGEGSTFWPLAVGVAGALGLTIFAWFTAYADGRFIWLSYPFAIPLALMYRSRYNGVEPRQPSL